MKKAIVIISAVTTILYSIFLIVLEVNFFNYSCYVIGELTYGDGIRQLVIRIVPICFVIFISLLVLLNIRLYAIFRILSVIISAIVAILTIVLTCAGLYFLVVKKVSGDYLFVITFIISAPAILITLLTFIRRALKLEQK